MKFKGTGGVGLHLSPGNGGSRFSWSSYWTALSKTFAFYSDGTISGSQILDKSSNGNHATVQANLVTDGDAEFGSSMVQWTSGTVSNSTEQAHGGTKSFKYVKTSAGGLCGMQSQRYRTVSGEVVNWSFWVFRVTNAAINLQVIKGNGSGVAYQNLGAVPTLNTWVQYSGSYTENAPGENGHIRFYITTGDMTLYMDDLSVTITGKSQLVMVMPDVAALKTIDANNLFYTSTGIPRALRTDIGDPSINNSKIFCGGSKKFVFTSSIPTIREMYELHTQFIDHDWPFDSCENVVTVGAGKTYATIAAAYTGINGVTTSYTNRYRIDVYDNQSVTQYAEYTYAASGGYQDVFGQSKGYTYLNGVNRVTIEGTLPDDATDDQMAKATIGDFYSIGGAKNIIFKKTNGRYVLHIDAALSNTDLRFVDCEFHNYGMDQIVAYRNANTLPLPTETQGGITPLGMGHYSNQKLWFINCVASGIHALTSHSDVASGAAGYMQLYNCDFDSAAIYHPTYNATSSVMNTLRLDGTTHTVPSNCYIMKTDLNNSYTSNESWSVSSR